MLRGLVNISLCLLLLLGCVEALAEVSVRTDRDGNYVTTQVVYSGPYGAERKVWSARGRASRAQVALNPYGDFNGDLFPTVVESSVAPYAPLVVWSRFNATEYDLAWSTWTKNGWTEISAIATPDGAGDDLDPAVAFNEDGRAFLVWWRDEVGGGRVYLSVMLSNDRWMSPFLISQLGTDSRLPRMEVVDDASVLVEYETPAGTVSQVVALASPDTITDDINPQARIVVKEQHLVGSEKH